MRGVVAEPGALLSPPPSSSPPPPRRGMSIAGVLLSLPGVLTAKRLKERTREVMSFEGGKMTPRRRPMIHLLFLLFLPLCILTSWRSHRARSLDAVFELE